jgi:hypothetical protein
MILDSQNILISNFIRKYSSSLLVFIDFISHYLIYLNSILIKYIHKTYLLHLSTFLLCKFSYHNFLLFSLQNFHMILFILCYFITIILAI